MSTQLSYLRTAVIAGVLVVGGLSACSSDDDGDATGTTEAPSAEESSGEETTGEEAAADGVVTVEMYDYGYELPETVPAGTTLEVVNTSDQEVHEVVLLRISDDETRSVEELLELDPEEIEGLMADGTLAMVGVGFAAPESDEGIYPLGELVVEEPGRYALICDIATGADPEEWLEAAEAAPGPPDVGDGPPHLVHGMWAELNVS